MRAQLVIQEKRSGQQHEDEAEETKPNLPVRWALL
jgi:hypothetical protein